MSVEAITWALKQSIELSSAKFVLVVLANCASGDSMLAHPSTAYLAEATGQDRKTVIKNLQRLRELGFIEDTGQRRGGTGQVVVYRLNASESVQVEQAQKRNSSESGTVPKTTGNSPVFPQKESRFSAKESQKRDTEPSEPSGNRKSNQNTGTREQVALPVWLDRELWVRWVNHRKAIRKPLTDDAAELSIRKLTELREQGHDPRDVIDAAVLNGWQGLFPPPVDRTRPPPNRPGPNGSTAPSKTRTGIENLLRMAHDYEHDGVAASGDQPRHRGARVLEHGSDPGV